MPYSFLIFLFIHYFFSIYLCDCFVIYECYFVYIFYIYTVLQFIIIYLCLSNCLIKNDGAKWCFSSCLLLPWGLGVGDV